MPTLQLCPDDADEFWTRFVTGRKPCLFQSISADLQPLVDLCTATNLRAQAVRISCDNSLWMLPPHPLRDVEPAASTTHHEVDAWLF